MFLISMQKQRKANEKNQVSLPVEEEVDESEMIYVMGGNSPPGSKSMEWDMFSGIRSVD